nr:RNA polymerase sigma factor SigJ [Salsipaludibacter albus]
MEVERRRLFGLAYRMIGEVAEAEDAVQDALARWAAADQDSIREPSAWLTTVTTRICIDRLTSARRRRETYVGPWLPEPVLTGDERRTDPADAAATADSMTLAFLVVLESLSPAERAVFLLHDVFGHPHAEIARMLGRSHAAVRQLASRARSHLDDRRPRYEVDPQRRHDVAAAFLAACEGGEVEDVLAVLSPDVTLVSDGGGKASAARRPVVGPDRVARFLLGVFRQAGGDAVASTVDVNGEPGLVGWVDGEVVVLFVLHVEDDRIAGIQAIRNPDKLSHLAGRVDTPGPVEETSDD